MLTDPKQIGSFVSLLALVRGVGYTQALYWLSVDPLHNCYSRQDKAHLECLDSARLKTDAPTGKRYAY